MLIYLIEQIPRTKTTSLAYLYDKNKQTNKKRNKTYAGLISQAQQSTGRKEVVGLIHKAAKFLNRFDQYNMM